ncbi:MAG: 50S ribosomal protein L25, partial [Planktomarina sp.]
QRDKVKDLSTHFDLMRLRRTTKIALYIPVEFINEETCTGLKKGGSLNIVRQEVELVVTASDIPEKIVVDLDGLDFGDSITASNLNFPAGSKPSIDRDFVVVTIASPSGITATDEEEGEATEAAAEE